MRKIYGLITAQWLAHFADEWIFGLPAWVTRHFEPLPAPFWISMMTVVTVPMIMLGWAASRPSAGSRIRLVCAGVQMLFFSNAFFHLITTYVFGEYSPGTASGVVLFLPLSLVLWRIVLGEPEVTKSSFATALSVGFVVHGLLLLNLLVDKSSW
ncbi:MAG: HXXEE domain-containing protein [Gammaproteobacteria bacterium]|nr:HXXEE domain-containing protein [Gammaproteobacteria bacterium]